MLQWKKIAASVAAAALAVTSTACTTFGSSTAYAMTIDGTQVKAGVYIYYSYAAYMEFVDELEEQDSDLDTSDNKVVKKQSIDGEDAETWIKNKALEYCQRFVAVQQKFEEAGLSLDEDEETEIDDTMESFWESNGDTYEKNGISKSSVTQVLENTYMTNDLFLYYYDVDGEEGTTEDELKEYYEENNARVRYIKFDLTDGNGDALDDDGKADMKAMVEDYLGQLEALSGDDDAMDDEMDAIESDYDAYVTSISEEAAAATSATDEDGNEIATTTTEETTTTTTTTTEAVAETEDTAETTVTASDAEETTTAAEDAESDSETETEAASDEETTTAAEDEETEEETTTTTAAYASESIIAKVTTDEDTDEEDLTYTPCEAVYNYVFDEAELGVAAMVEDEDAYYIVVRRDITERMTEDDLWTESQVTTVVSQKYADTFEDMLLGWCDEQNVEKNDRAIKRYDPFKIDMSSDT
jgi:hypothetical protein